MNSKLPASQLTAWLVVASIAPILSMVGGVGWIGVITTALFCVAIIICQSCLDCELPKWMQIVQMISIAVYIGAVGKESISCWAVGTDTSVLSVVLLSLAAIASSKGVQRCGRACAVLLWFVVPLVSAVLLAGYKDLDVLAIRTNPEMFEWALLPVFLLPALGRFYFKETGRRTWRFAFIGGIIAAAISIWMDASLTPEVARKSENTFYEFSKGVNLLGVAKRFEAVSACMLTAGWFALLCFFLSVTHRVCENIKIASGTIGVWTVAGVAALGMYNLHISMEVLAIFVLICWGFLPILTQGIGQLKTLKNVEKWLDKRG